MKLENINDRILPTILLYNNKLFLEITLINWTN